MVSQGVFLLKQNAPEHHAPPKKLSLMIVHARLTSMELKPLHATPNALTFPLDLVEIPRKLIACAKKTTMEMRELVHALHARTVLPTLHKLKTKSTEIKTANAKPATTRLLPLVHVQVVVLVIRQLVEMQQMELQSRGLVIFALLATMEKQTQLVLLDALHALVTVTSSLMYLLRKHYLLRIKQQ
jgi:hypothetical protein